MKNRHFKITVHHEKLTPYASSLATDQLLESRRALLANDEIAPFLQSVLDEFTAYPGYSIVVRAITDGQVIRCFYKKA